MKTMLVAVVLGMAACGGTEKTASPSRFAGTWNGQAEFNSQAPFTRGTAPATVQLTDLASNQVRLSGFCPDGSGAVDLDIESVQAVAHNVAICGSVTVGSCAETQLIFSFVDAEVLPDGSLRGLASGWAVGCGASSVATILLTAQRGN